MGKTRDFFKTNSNALLSIIIGLLLAIRPGSGIRLAAIVVGILVLVSGIVDIVGYMNNTAGAGINIITGVVKIVFGIIILTHTGAMIAILVYIFGIFILIGGIQGIVAAMTLKNSGSQNWVICMAISVAIIAASTIMMVFPFRAIATAVAIAGIILVINGILGIATKKQV